MKPLLFLLISIVFLAGCIEAGSAPLKSGRIVFTISDEAANLSSIQSVRVTVDDIEVYNATEGWIDILDTPKTYDLVALKTDGTQRLLADVNLTEGKYEQIKLHILQVVVVDNSTNAHQAKLPANELKITGDVFVYANSTSTVALDFLLDESLYVSQEEDYVMAPVIRVESRINSNVQITSSNIVEITGGSVVDNVTIGMDINGTVAPGLRIPPSASISTNGSTIVIISGLLS